MIKDLVLTYEFTFALGSEIEIEHLSRLNDSSKTNAAKNWELQLPNRKPKTTERTVMAPAVGSSPADGQLLSRR
jgi:hypothetical protein